MPLPTSWATILACTLLLICRTSEAHSIWIESLSVQGRLAIHAGFGEPFEWDRRSVAKISHTEYALYAPDGTEHPLTLQLHPRAECFVTDLEWSGPAIIAARCDYGIARHGPPALVAFTAKRYIGAPTDWTSLNAKTLFTGRELSATLNDSRLELRLTAGGQPVAEAKVTWVGPTGEQSGTTAAAGLISIDKAVPGAYAIIAVHRIPKPGERDGQAYDSEVEVTTLSLEIPAAGEVATLAADEAAATELRTALGNQSLWDDRFPGFQSKLSVKCQGVIAEGTCSISADGTATVKLTPTHDELHRQVSEWLESMAWHRAQRHVGQPQSPAAARPRPLSQIAFADPQGASTVRCVELVPLQDPFESRFWIAGGQLQAAQRRLGERRQTISILAAQQQEAGGAIPTMIATSFWDLNGQLLETESEHRQWTEVGGYLLPDDVHVVTTIAKQPLLMREIGQFAGGSPLWRTLHMDFVDPQLLSPVSPAATAEATK